MRTPVVACAELKKTDRQEPTHFCPNSRKRRIPVIGPLWRAALREKQGPAVAAPEGLLNQLSFLPSRNPKSAGPLKRTQILPAARLHRPTAQRFLPPLGTPIVPPLLVHPRRDHPAGLPFPARNGPPAARAPSVPPSTCGESIPLEGYLPARPEPSGVLTVYPGVAGAGSRERSRTREAFGVRPRAGAIWGTATVPRSATRLRMVCTPAASVAQSTALSLGYPASSPARGGCTRTGGLGLKTAKLCLQSSLPSATAEVAGSRQRSETRFRVGGSP